MKRNIKMLAILVIVPVMALFTMCVISSSGKAIPHGIKGHFAARGNSFCWYALDGFDPNGIAKGDWSGGPSIFEAEYTFNNDGTGTASGEIRGLELGSPLAKTDQPSVWSGSFSQVFTYTVDGAGFITITTDLGEFSILRPGFNPFYCDTWTSNGVLSTDGKTIMITSGPPTIFIQMIQDPAGNWHVMGPQQACILSIYLTKLSK